MKINLNIFKQYSPFPIMKNCFGCNKVKPMYVIDKDVFVSAQSAAKKVVKETAGKLTEIKMQIVSPFDSKKKFFGNLNIDLNKKQNIVLEETGNSQNKMILEYNPKNTGRIYKGRGKTKKPMEVAVLKSFDEKWETSYVFMTKDLKEQTGYVKITEPDLVKKNNRDFFIYNYKELYLMKDFPELGIKGKRIFVDYLKNMDEKKYSGIGSLADRVCVEHCMKKKIKPQILSDADMDSGKGSAPHIAHYKRGKRFLPLKDSNALEFFQEKYRMTDLNKIIQSLLDNSKRKKIDTKDWGLAPMYLPREKVKEYMKLAHKEPILHD